MSSAIDKIFDQFEELIDVESSERKYAQALLAAVTQLIKCQMLWRLQSIDQSEWMSLQRIRNSGLIQYGDFSVISDRQLGQELTARLPHSVGGSLVWSQDTKQWIVVSISEKEWSDGLLVAQFATQLADADLSQIVPILKAAGELLLAHGNRWQSSRAAIRSQRLQGFAKNLSALNGLQEAHFTVVNDLRVLLQADQVALCQKTWFGAANVVAVSDSVNPRAGTKVSKDVVRLAAQTFREKTTQFEEVRSADSPENSCWLMSVPARVDVRERTPAYTIAILWNDPDRYEEGVATLRANWAAINSMASHSLFVQALPAFLRKGVFSKRAMLGLGGRLLFGLALISVTAWLLFYPLAFTIEGQAVLEPISQGYVFASNDGVVEQIKVDSGAYVRENQNVITIRSTEIQLRLEELQGEILALQEKRNGYRLTLNQLGNEEKKLAQRSQLSADIAELDIREDSLQKTIQLLEQESLSLALTSPLDGEIVTENIRETLEHRPVRRGEALLHVANTKGPWQFKVEVPDFEAGHLLEAIDTDPQLKVRIRLASAPESEVDGRVMRIADSHIANNVDSPKWVVYVSYIPEQIPSPRFGSTANVRFDCGQKPAWYVWLRPVWEGLRRRFWL